MVARSVAGMVVVAGAASAVGVDVGIVSEGVVMLAGAASCAEARGSVSTAKKRAEADNSDGIRSRGVLRWANMGINMAGKGAADKRALCGRLMHH